MKSPTATPPPEHLLPSAFDGAQLWAFCAQESRFGRLLEGVVLADPGTAGLAQLHALFPATGPGHALVMAFGLEHLLRLRDALACDRDQAGVLDAQALGLDRAWPRWFSRPVGSYLVWLQAAGQAVAVWVRARTQGEAAVCVARVHPDAQILGMGLLEDLEAQIQRLEAIVRDQDFGALFCDVRTHAARPASAAHIAGYPLAAMGLHPTPQHAMAAQQAWFLAEEPADAHAG